MFFFLLFNEISAVIMLKIAGYFITSICLINILIVMITDWSDYFKSVGNEMGGVEHKQAER